MGPRIGFATTEHSMKHSAHPIPATPSVPGEGAIEPLHVRYRDAVLEEAAAACEANSAEVGRYVVDKERVGEFFALLLRKMRTRQKTNPKTGSELPQNGM